MTLQVINNGTGPGDAGAETVYAAFAKAKANFAELYGLYGSEVEAFTFTTKQNDLAVADYTRVVRWNGAGTTGITGIAAPSSGARILTIVNATTDYLLWLENQNTASAAANRLMLPDGHWAPLMPGDTITVMYDGTAARWRVVSWPTRGAKMGFDLFLDAWDLTTTNRTASLSGAGASAVVSGTGVSTTDKAKGCLSLATGTTTTGYAHHHNGSNAQMMSTLGPYLMGYRVAPSNLPDATDTFEIEIGLSQRITTTAFASGALWSLYWNGSAAEWRQRCGNAGVLTDSTTGSPTPGTSPVELYIFINPAGTRADFLKSEDGVSVVLCTSQGGLPASSVAIGFQECCTKTAGTNSRSAIFDWRGYRVGNAEVRP